MNRKMVPVSKCEVGTIIAEDVINCWGSILITKNSVLNDYIKGRLIDLGILNVYMYTSEKLELKEITGSIYDRVENSYTETILKVKQVLVELSSGGKLDIQQISNLSELVYENIYESFNVIKCINDLKNKDEYTYTHCVDVAFYAMLIAKWLNLPKDNIEDVIKTGLLHDIGKVLVPDEILNKKDKLLEEEFTIMKSHALYGYNSIKDLKEISQPIKEAVLSHHERMDGSGYPNGLLGEKINLYTKIIAIADVYDAMTKDRVYKKGVTPFEAFEMFQTLGIGIFDIGVLNVFLKNIVINLIGLNVTLENGERGEIVYIPPNDITKPIILSSSGIIDLSLTDKRIISIG